MPEHGVLPPQLGKEGVGNGWHEQIRVDEVHLRQVQFGTPPPNSNVLAACSVRAVPY
jgi:hypothetical protein